MKHWVLTGLVVMGLAGCAPSGPVLDPLFMGQVGSDVGNLKPFRENFILMDATWEDAPPTDFLAQNLGQNKLTWMNWNPTIWHDPTALQYQHILDGEWDEYIQEWAVAIKAFQYPVLINLAGWANDPGKPWSVQNNGSDPDQYKAVFKAVVDIFRDEGANNVHWIWMISVAEDGVSWASVSSTYPGDDYVDWIGVGMSRPDALNLSLDDGGFLTKPVLGWLPRSQPFVDWVMKNKTQVRGVIWSAGLDTEPASLSTLAEIASAGDIDKIQRWIQGQ